MKKISYLLAVLVLCAISVSATGISKNKAQTVAASFFQKGLVKDLSKSAEVKLVKEYASSVDAPAAVYAFSRGENVVFVSAEDKMPSILGYAENADLDDMPPALDAMLHYYANLTEAVRRGQIEAPKLYASAESVDTLLRTSWYQKAPFWDLCPELDGKKTYNGCVSTAFAQIMKYYNWPEKPTGKTTEYTAPLHNLKIPSVDLESHKYNWDKMPGVYDEGKYTEEQGHEVAQLCYDLAAAFRMDFDTIGSGTQLPIAARAVRDNFGYNKDMKIDYADYYTEEEWVAKLKNELNQGRPLPYCGMSPFAGGHCFVIDGYNTDGLFHVNWGWRGKFSGYFLITTLDYKKPGFEGEGSVDGFYAQQQTLFDFFPDREGTTTTTEERYQIQYHYCASGNSSLKYVEMKYFSNRSIDNFKGSLIMQLIDENGKLAAEQTVKKDCYFRSDTTGAPLTIELDGSFDFSNIADGVYHTELIAVSDSTGNKFPVHHLGTDDRLIVRNGVFKGAFPSAELEGKILSYEVSINNDMMIDVKMKAQITNIDNFVYSKLYKIFLEGQYSNGSIFAGKNHRIFKKDLQPGESCIIEGEFAVIVGDYDDEYFVFDETTTEYPLRLLLISHTTPLDVIEFPLKDFLTGIKDIKINKEGKSAAFNISGQRVNASNAKGVIIKDGKKALSPLSH